MAIRRIVKYGESILNKKTQKIDYKEMKNELDNIITDMFDTLNFVHGVGLSANQVGLDMQLSVISIENKEEKKSYNIVIINPQIVSYGGEIIEEDEVCLSFPGLFIKVKRHTSVVVRALNQKGIPIEIKASGLLAKALQHEIDHLNGITFIKRIPIAQRLKLKPTLLKLKKQWKAIDESKMKPEVM